MNILHRENLIQRWNPKESNGVQGGNSEMKKGRKSVQLLGCRDKGRR